MRIRKRSEGESDESVVIVGSRDMNSGIKLIRVSITIMLEVRTTYPYLIKSAII